MPPRRTPTIRQRRLGTELRRLREQAALSPLEAAAILGADRARVSNIEKGRFGISAERLRALVTAYGCEDQALVSALAEMAQERKGQWWERYRDLLPPGFLDLAEVEHHATALRTAQIVHLPGLLQTEDYARAMFDAVVPPLPSAEVRRRLNHRMDRQEVLDRPQPSAYQGIVHEAALRMQFGGPRMARAQLDHLLETSEREHITLLVVPFGAGSFPGPGQSVLYAKGVVPQLDTVHLDTYHGPAFVDAQVELEKYRSLLDRMEEMALDPAGSRDVIHRIAQEL